jgi:hypothetical protein
MAWLVGSSSRPCRFEAGHALHRLLKGTQCTTWRKAVRDRRSRAWTNTQREHSPLRRPAPASRFHRCSWCRGSASAEAPRRELQVQTPQSVALSPSLHAPRCCQRKLTTPKKPRRMKLKQVAPAASMTATASLLAPVLVLVWASARLPEQPSQLRSPWPWPCHASASPSLLAFRQWDTAPRLARTPRQLLRSLPALQERTPCGSVL